MFTLCEQLYNTTVDTSNQCLPSFCILIMHQYNNTQTQKHYIVLSSQPLKLTQSTDSLCLQLTESFNQIFQYVTLQQYRLKAVQRFLNLSYHKSVPSVTQSTQ